MKPKTVPLKVQTFKNRNGTSSYRVFGYIHGERIRKNFKSRDDAIAEKSALEIRFAQDEAQINMVGTMLSSEQVREAEAAFALLKESASAGRSLAFCVQFTLANHRASEKSKPLAEAVEAYRKHRAADLAKNLISQPQYDTIRNNLTLLREAFPRHSIADLTGDKLRVHFSRGNAELKTFNNRRGVVSTFLIYAKHQGWLSGDPLEKVPAYRISRKQRGTATTLTAKKAAELMDYVENYRNGAFVPFFALCLFAGIRPDSEVGEISKLTPEAINMATGVIHVEPHISKVNMRRNVTIHPNLAAWLRAYPLEKFPILATNIKQERTRIAKMFGLSHDVLRHTFISMHVGKYRSLGDAALQAGNSEEIIRKHYLDVKSQSEAEAFFSIMPKKPAEAEAITPAAAAPSAAVADAVRFGSQQRAA